MKTLQNVIMLFLALSAFNASAQMSKAKTTKLVGAKTYTFIPTTVGYQDAAEKSLTGFLYFLSVKPDSIITFLPGFSRIGTDGPGVLYNQSRAEYLSTKFSYITTKNKNGAWDIAIEFKDTPAASKVKMRLWIYTNGYATLIVNKTSDVTKTYRGHLLVEGERSLSKK